MKLATPAERTKYTTRKFLLREEVQREGAIAAIRNAPLDASKPLECLLREEVKARKPDQNALMWAGPMRDIAEQGYVDGKPFSADVWHEFFKREYLPEEYDPKQCKEGYRKWDYMANGERVLVGSTKDLTVSGFATYLTQIEAYAAGELGVQFSVSPREKRSA